MAKRARIVMLISMLCLCVSLLVVGVFAVSTITFNVSSSLNYELVSSPTYFTYDDSNNITGLSEEYLSLETKPETLVIPNKDANGNNITSILDGTLSSPTFKGLASSNVTIQEGITSIGDYAFYNCSSLTSIELPNSLISIGESAFRSCRSLTSLELPNSLTSIGFQAFSVCSSLTNIEIPSSVRSISRSAFGNCGLLQITVASENRYYSSLEGSLYNKAQTELLRGAGRVSTITILDTVTSIENDAFSGCTSLKSVDIPNNVRRIAVNAFYNCSSLTDLTLPSNITAIAEQSFAFCSSLTSIEIPNGVVTIVLQAFLACRSLTNIEIPSSVRSIGESAFSSCSSLTNIEIPSSVTSIGQYALSCANLTSLTINTKPGYVWQKASNSTFTSNLSTVDVSDPSRNARWFKNTYGYRDYYWRQIEESAA